MLLYPALLLHELTHYVFSLPWADELSIEIRLGPESAVYASWRNDAPLWGIALAHLAPTVVGVLSVPIMFTGVPEFGPFAMLLLIANWVVFIWPSKDDRTLPV